MQRYIEGTHVSKDVPPRAMAMLLDLMVRGGQLTARRREEVKGREGELFELLAPRMEDKIRILGKLGRRPKLDKR